VKRFLSELEGRGVVPMTVWHYKDVGENRNAAAEVKAFNPDDPFATPKPEKLIQRILHIGSGAGDLVLDSFLGSGTTAAVAHKMGRRWIGIEEGEHAKTHCLPRLTAVVDGEQGGISKDVGWQGGGGFRFLKLGPTVFDDDGLIRQNIPYAHLAAHVWFVETGTPRRTRQKDETPLLGVHEGTAYYLLYNGILGDRSVDGGNVLTLRLLSELPAHDGPKVIYGEATRLSADRLSSLGVVFKQIPYELKAT
jgi:adenine-specific DNA-methyltransferase